MRTVYDSGGAVTIYNILEIFGIPGRLDAYIYEQPEKRRKRIEDASVVRSILGNVTPEEGRVLRVFMSGRLPSDPAGRELLALTLDRLRAEHTA